MNSIQINIVLISIIVIVICQTITYTMATKNSYPDAIQLVGYSNRRARMSRSDHQQESYGSGTGVTLPMKKQKADIETVKQNIEEYNKLLKVDTKKLTEQQKDILERIVERVARLKESFDIDLTNQEPNNKMLPSATVSTLPPTIMTTSLPETSSEEPETKLPSMTTTTIPTVAIDSSSASSSSSSSSSSEEDEIESETGTTSILSGTAQTTATTTTTQIPNTSSPIKQEQMSEARASNIVSNNRVLVSNSNNSKNRTRVRLNSNSNKRPSSSSSSSSSSASTKTASKRTNGHRHPAKTSSSSSGSVTSSGSSVSAVSGSGTTTISNNGQHTPSTISIQPQLGLKQQQQQIQQIKIQAQLQKNRQQQQDEIVRDVLVKQQNLHHQHHLQQQNQKNHHLDTLDLPAEQKTLTSILDHRASLSSNQQSLSSSSSQSPIISIGGTGPDSIYGNNVTTSAIIDSLQSQAREDYYNQGPQHTEISSSSGSGLHSNNKEKKTPGTIKPTKYHFYPHNQHIYLLPECAIQQVCNAVYVRLNYTQPLCACPSRYREPCSASLSEDDLHTTKLIGDSNRKAITLAKTCESTTEMRECRAPKDWSLLALQNTRTGKSHYLVICRCPAHFKLEGPMAHDQPTYASVPGIRVFGMMCVKPGYSVRKPSPQPPKRYQLQKPFYIPSSSNKYNTNSNLNNNKNTRPIYQQQQQHDSYQSQHQSNYEYLHRPDSISSSNTEYPDSLSLDTFGGGIYGRNNERKGETVKAEEETSEATTTVKASTETTEAKREKRSNYDNDDDNDDTPAFPWHRLEELQRSVVWD